MSFENMLSEVSETQHLHIVWFHSYVMSRIGTGTANGLLVTLAEGWKNRQCIQFSSVAQLCPTLCNPRPPCESQHTRPPCPSNLPEFTRTHVHRVRDAIQPSHPLSSPSPPAPNSFLPKKSWGWSPSKWTCWISLPPKGLSRVFSNTTVQKHQFFCAQLSSQSNSHIHTWSLEKP